MRTAARNDHERKMVNAFSQHTAGPMPTLYTALWTLQHNPRYQRLIQEGIERRRARAQGKYIAPLPVAGRIRPEAHPDELWRTV